MSNSIRLPPYFIRSAVHLSQCISRNWVADLGRSRVIGVRNLASEERRLATAAFTALYVLRRERWSVALDPQRRRSRGSAWWPIAARRAISRVDLSGNVHFAAIQAAQQQIWNNPAHWRVQAPRRRAPFRRCAHHHQRIETL